MLPSFPTGLVWCRFCHSLLKTFRSHTACPGSPAAAPGAGAGVGAALHTPPEPAPGQAQPLHGPAEAGARAHTFLSVGGPRKRFNKPHLQRKLQLGALNKKNVGLFHDAIAGITLAMNTYDEIQKRPPATSETERGDALRQCDELEEAALHHWNTLCSLGDILNPRGVARDPIPPIPAATTNLAAAPGAPLVVCTPGQPPAPANTTANVGAAGAAAATPQGVEGPNHPAAVAAGAAALALGLAGGPAPPPRGVAAANARGVATPTPTFQPNCPTLFPQQPAPPPPADAMLAQMQKNVKAAMKYLNFLNLGGPSRAVRALERTGSTFQISQQSVEAKIRPLFPQPKGGPLTEAELSEFDALTEDRSSDILFTFENTQRYINHKRPDLAAGLSGLSIRIVKRAWKTASEEQRSTLCLFLERLGNAHVPKSWARLLAILNSLRGVPLPKPNAPPDAVRPIGVAEILVTLADGIVSRASREVATAVSEGNLAIGVPGGAEIAAHAIRAGLAADPTTAHIGLDVRNAFGTAARRIALSELARLIREGRRGLIPILRRVVSLIRAGLSIHFFNDKNERFSLPIDEGLFQGWTHAVLLYVLVHNWGVRRLHENLPPTILPRLVKVNFADDGNFLLKNAKASEVYTIITTAREAFDQCTGGLGIDKTVIHRPCTDDAEHENFCNLSDELGLKIDYRNRREDQKGSIVSGAAIGTHAFVARHLQSLTNSTIEILDKLVQLHDAHSIADNKRQAVERTRQALVCVIRLCIQARAAYWKRVQPPAAFDQYARIIDDRVYAAIQHMVHIRHQDLTLVRGHTPDDDNRRAALLRMLFELPTSCGGAGFQPNSGFASRIGYLSSFAQATPFLRTLAGNLLLEQLPPAAHNEAVPPVPNSAPFLPNVTAAALQAAQFVEAYCPGIPSVQVALSAIDTARPLDEAPRNLSEGMSRDCNEASFRFVLSHGSPSAYHRLLLLEKHNSAAAAWLTVIPSAADGTTMPDNLFIHAFREHLHLHPFPNPDLGDRGSVLCAACFLKNGRSVFLDEVHALACSSLSHTPEHNAVQHALHNAIVSATQHLNAGEVMVQPTPIYASVPGLRTLSEHERSERAAAPPFNLTRPPKQALVGDLLVRMRPNSNAVHHETMLIDFVVSSPPTSFGLMSTTAPLVKALTDKWATSREEALKRAAFRTSYDVSNGSHISFFPFAIGSTGVLGHDAEIVLKTIASSIDSLGASDTSRYSTMQQLLERVSVAIHAGIGGRISRLVHRQRHLTPEMAQRRAQGGGAPAAMVPGAARALLPVAPAQVGPQVVVQAPVLGGAPGAVPRAAAVAQP